MVRGTRSPREQQNRVEWPWVWGLYAVVLGIFVAFVVAVALSGDLDFGEPL